MTTNLVVADKHRTDKTICLAVTPALKAYGIPGRARLFEVVQKVNGINALRRRNAPGHVFTGASYQAPELDREPGLSLDYLVAPPRMARYMALSAEIYQIYLKYVAPEDIHVYSVDEVFIDVTNYLATYKMTARELAMKMILDILHSTGITATAGIGTNLYLCKVAMDICAKHIPPDENGVRIARLDEMSYRRQLWTHRPLTDFWRVGRGYAKKLEAHGLFTMGDIARCSVGSAMDHRNEALLYRLFGVNAELLIDHAWGWEPCTLPAIKSYTPTSRSIGSGQVLQCPYSFVQTRVVLREMAEALALDLAEKDLITNQLTITVGYDIDNLRLPGNSYSGTVKKDFYGRSVPKHAHGTVNLPTYSSSSKQILSSVLDLFDRIVDPKLLVRRLNITANNPRKKAELSAAPSYEQMDLFADNMDRADLQKTETAALAREQQQQDVIISIKNRFGKNAILTGTNFEDGATGRDRNRQIGGHKA